MTEIYAISPLLPDLKFQELGSKTYGKEVHYEMGVQISSTEGQELQG